MTKFTFVELFAGIGGVSFGFERLGGRCLLAAEYDPERAGKRQFAQESYQILHPNVPMTGDVCELEGKDVPNHDVLSFTFPCQSFSTAGKRGGFKDVRGTLYFEAMRIANEKKPKIIFAENVKGIIGHDGGKTLDTIVKVANECGYRIDYSVLNSKYFGVPQNRERWFMIGVREDLIENEPWTTLEGNTVLPKSKRRINEYKGVKTFNFNWPEQSEVTTRLRDILETEVDEKYYLDEEKTAKLIAQLEETLPAHFPTPDDVNNTLRTGGKGSLTAKHNYDHIAEEIRPVLTPEFANKAQNGRRFKNDGEESFTLTSQDRHGVALGYGNVLQRSQSGVSQKDVYGTLRAGASRTDFGVVDENYPKSYRIRKLTPRECLRLQAFSDDVYEKLKNAGISDSQLYRMSGNAVTVNVIEAIGERLIPLIEK